MLQYTSLYLSVHIMYTGSLYLLIHAISCSVIRRTFVTASIFLVASKLSRTFFLILEGFRRRVVWLAQKRS